MPIIYLSEAMQIVSMVLFHFVYINPPLYISTHLPQISLDFIFIETNIHWDKQIHLQSLYFVPRVVP